jgi:hypothetical protein
LDERSRRRAANPRGLVPEPKDSAANSPISPVDVVVLVDGPVRNGNPTRSDFQTACSITMVRVRSRSTWAADYPSVPTGRRRRRRPAERSLLPIGSEWWRPCANPRVGWMVAPSCH